MKISCIIPFFNPGAYFRPAIESVLAQDRQPDEIILVDDGSTDGSVDVAREYSEHVNLIRQENAGSAVARNRGIHAASGDAIAFHDADDLWPAGRMRALASALEANSDADIVAGRVEFLAERPLSSAEAARFVSGHRPMQVASLLIRRSVFDRIGGFDDRVQPVEDTDFIMRVRASALSVELIEATTLVYRIHSTNVSRDIATNQAATLDALRSLSGLRRRAR